MIGHCCGACPVHGRRFGTKHSPSAYNASLNALSRHDKFDPGGSVKNFVFKALNSPAPALTGDGAGFIA